jgi:Tfp pilus assembly protein PilF
MLEEQGMLDEARAVYCRGLQSCNAKIAKFASGQINIQSIDDRNTVIDKIIGLAAGFLMNCDFAKALAAVDCALSEIPDAPGLNIYRAHALNVCGAGVHARSELIWPS